jgi:hypothetical protein
LVTEEMSEAELKEETPIREIRNYTIGGEEKGSSCSIEEKGDRSLGLASDIAYNNHKIPLKECNGDSVKKSRSFMQNMAICTNPSKDAVDTRAIKNSNSSEWLKKLAAVSQAENRN